MKTELELPQLRLLVRLGVDPEERVQPQPVDFHVKLRLNSPPRGMQTDSIADTICYDRICRILSEVSKRRPYHLIESLGASAYEALRSELSEEVAIELIVHKLRPPIEGLLGGVKFRCGDFQ